MKNYKSLCSRIVDGIKDIDFIGPQFSLQNNDSQRFQSVQGSCWSIFTILIMVIAGFLFGKEIYERKAPRVSSNRENIDNSDIYFSQFPLMFTLITLNGTVLTNQVMRKYLEPVIVRIHYDENGKLKLDSKIIDFERCNSEKFSKYSSQVISELSKYNDDRYFCLKFENDDYFSNTIFSKNSTNYNIGFKKCRENCAQDIDIVLKQLLLDISYITSFVDVNNYLEPIKIYMEHLTTQIDIYLFRRSYMRFVYNALVSDYGWFIESLETNEIPYLESLVPDDMGYMVAGNNEDCLFLLSVESPKSRNVFNRSYMKLQELLANLGGLSNAVIVFIRLISDSHLKFVMYFFIKTCAIQSLEKNYLEISLSQNMKDGQAHFNQAKLEDKKQTKGLSSQDRKIYLDSTVRKNNGTEHPEGNPIQTIIKFKNNAAEDQSSVRNVKNIDAKSNSSNSEAHHLKDQLKLMKDKMSYFSPSVIQNLKKSKGNESFFGFLMSRACCQHDQAKNYSRLLKSIRRLISIHTYTTLIINQCGKEEYDAYDSLRANN